MNPRISLVKYLNAAPLGWAFLHGPYRERFQVIPSTPSCCADQLASGEADIGLIPSIEYQRIQGLRIIPGLAIAALNRVRSVLLVKRKGGGTIRTVALDTGSRTSIVLLKILLTEKMGLNPEFVPHEPDIAAMIEKCDAALLIGDAALQLDLEKYEILDLAESWREWQQRPFVFAFWACREEARLPDDVVEIFHQAIQWGLEARPEIAARYADSLGLQVSFLEEYLSRNIDYGFGYRHVEGLEKFYRLAADKGYIPRVNSLAFLS